MADIKKIQEALNTEVLVMLYKKLPISVLEEQQTAENVEKVWKDFGDNPKWFVMREQNLDFPPYMKVHACKNFRGRIDTGAVEIDAVLTAATRDAIYLDKMAIVG